MEQYIIKGGHPLVGEVEIGGAKNAALAILAAGIMTDDTVRIDNLPDVNDINVLLSAIEGIGANVHRVDRHTVTINGRGIKNFSIEYDYIKKIRASYYLLGALLGKYKRAEVALPGGCNIGSRPIDQHLKGFRALGADVDIEHGKIIAEADRLVGKHIYFDVVSVGATINVMMAATMADGLTIMENVAKEPHVVDVANFLNSMGANIRGAGTDVIKIRGVRSLHGTDYSVIPDQIEAGTFMFAAAATRGDVTVLNVIPKHLEATIAKLLEIGCEVEEFDDAVRVVSKGGLRSTHVKTLPYPGFPTDMQPQIGVTLALCKGTSTITESIFENRFKYLDELARMGGSVKIEGNSATIEGVKEFSGARVSAPDLRAGAALCIAGLAADGITIVDDIVYIQRGYERFDEKLRGIGAVMEKVETERQIQKFMLKVS
ncbi:UDP-N-acetylglucosamine 1-carboxyvinyltransferase [Lachnospiraceae bacterium MD308]|nr:UDP-N-acetylglucosamine 1-carboxyvinyltransferase [Lachnospiraceae bacterium MD308]MCI8579166.1 UDP-N-acetylglucosamine 1-carboxyvinyltransferase [Dorea sp.]